MFLKIRNTHTLASVDLNAEPRDSLTVRCLNVFFVLLFSKISILSAVLFPAFFTPGGIRFLVEVAAEMCVTESGVLRAGVSLVLPIPWGEEKACSCQHQGRKRKVCQAVVQLGPAHTKQHMGHTACDGRQRRAQLPSCYWTQGRQLLNALHPLSKQTPWTARSSFQSG